MTRNGTHHWCARHAGMLRALELAVVLFVNLLGGCQGQPPPQASSVQLKGSETLRPLLTMCAEDFMARHPHIDVMVQGGGSGIGIAALFQGTVDIAMASRELSDVEWREYDYDLPALVQAVEHGHLDAAIAALPMTAATEERVDFSHAYFHTGLGMAVRHRSPEPVWGHRGLGQLQVAEFLYETSLFPEHAYTFKHALTHEVAYNSLLQEQRRALHTRIVEAIEGLSADRLTEQVERLAHHALRGEVWDKALAYCRQAGAKAATRSALREAMAYFEQALTALQHLPERRETLEQAIDLRLSIRSALIALGELRAIFDHLRAAETLATALDDQRRLGWVCAYMITAVQQMGDYEGGLAYGQRALAIATASGDFALEMMATFSLGIYYNILGNYRQAAHYHRKNAEALVGERRYERFGEAALPSVASASRFWFVRSLAELGDFTEGNTQGAEAVRIVETVEQPFVLSNAYLGLGFLHLRQGDLPQAIARLEKGLEICQTTDVRLQLQFAAGALGYAYVLSGRLAEAQPLLAQAVELTTARPIGPYPLWAAHLGEAYLLAGRPEDAHQLAERALARARDCKQPAYEAYALRLYGEIAAQRTPLEVEPAAAAYQQAITLATELGMRPLQAHCHRGLGSLYAKTGRPEPARAELSAAITLYRAMDMTFWLPQGEAVLAQVA